MLLVSRDGDRFVTMHAAAVALTASDDGIAERIGVHDGENLQKAFLRATGRELPARRCGTTKKWSREPEHQPRAGNTEYRPLPLAAVRRLALARLNDPRPRAATTAEEIRCLDT